MFKMNRFHKMLIMNDNFILKLSFLTYFNFKSVEYKNPYK